jgi:hypothetical protein
MGRLALAASLAATPVTAAVAQTTQPSQRGQQAQQQQRRPTPGNITVPVSGLVGAESSTVQNAPLTGTLTIQHFARSDQGLAAVGILTANITDPTTETARTIVAQVALPVAAGTGPGEEVPDNGPAVIAQTEESCSALHLVLGPLDLNLLGVRVQLNEVVLDITGVPGAGNLLGNLLCTITGLLDNPSQLGRLLSALNELLDVLG